ncbi:SRPBCC family protein [Schlesneria sp. DSM 10557]|uniref:SRPBCC family protein n=1 Tax=Schlesneria sp. DSM 10557 TaxID=3044399 RepID=UPI0035A020A7
MKAEITKAPVAETEMLIRRPVADVFEAFINPDVITQFWFTRSTGRLAAGQEVTWYWDMYAGSTRVVVVAFEPHQRVQFEWDGYSGRTTVEWKFTARDDSSTFVTITESGWTGTGDELVKYVADSTQGFTWTLAGAKAYLEHGIKLNFVADKCPDAHVAGWSPQ